MDGPRGSKGNSDDSYGNRDPDPTMTVIVDMANSKRIRGSNSDAGCVQCPPSPTSPVTVEACPNSNRIPGSRSNYGWFGV